MSLDSITLRPFQFEDSDALWALLQPVFASGETNAQPRELTQEAGLEAWTGKASAVWLAERDGVLLGTYYLKPNYPGGGSHVANGGYIVSTLARGQGLGELLCRHSMAQAKTLSFRALQFNLVVSTNQGAVRLWQRCGFEIVGTLPGAFAHPTAGYVDAYVMFQSLV